MTISTTTNRVEYNGNGATVAFSFPYYFLADSDLVVILRTVATGAETTLTLTTHYTVSGALDPAGGTVTTVATYSSAYQLVIYRDPSLTQTTDITDNDPLPAQSIERPLDKLTMIVQRLAERVSRSFRLSDGDTTGGTTSITPVDSYLLGFDADGNLTTVNPDTVATVSANQNWVTDQFSGTGAQTAFTLSNDPGSVNALFVYVSGVRKYKTIDYTLSGTTLTFLVAPASGTNNISVQYGSVVVSTTTPADGTVTTSKIVDSAVTTAKIDDNAVTAAKIAAGAVTNSEVDKTIVTGQTAETSPAIDDLLLLSDTSESSGALNSITLANTLKVVNGLTEDTSPDLAADYVLTYDASASAAKKVLIGRASGPVSGTVVASTSGTAIDFTSIPAWVKRITVMFNSVSTNGTSLPIIQIGDSGGVETSGYSGAAGSINAGGGAGTTALNTGFIVSRNGAAADVMHGNVVITLVDVANNIWSAHGIVGHSNAAFVGYVGGTKALTAALDRVRITAVNGTDTFDAGSINILYE